MAGPIDKTMKVLASTANSHSLEVLIAALDVDHNPVQQAAVNLLIKRGSTRGHLEVVRRLPRLADAARCDVESQVGRLSEALRQALLHGDAVLRAHGLELIRSSECFELLPVVLDMLKDSRAAVARLAAEAMRDLTDRLYEHVRNGQSSRRPDRYLRNAAQIRHNVLKSFDRVLSNFSELNHQQDVIEAVMILGDAENFAVKKLLGQGGIASRQMAFEVLMNSRHPGVMQLALESMSMNYPPPQVFDVIARRGDPEFIAHLLRSFPKRLTPQQTRNFRQVESVSWIDADRPALEEVPPGLQPALVEFTSACGLPSALKLQVHEWVVRHGTPEGRLAASNVLGTMDETTVQSIVAGGLESEDEEIQAWATHQLRSQGIPEALSILVERLDSPLEAVRAAARDELKGFDVPMMLDMFENIDPLVCRRAGLLIRKIDPDSGDKLRRELECPISRRKIRAARAAGMLGMHEEVMPSLLALLGDSDPLVRRAGVAAVAEVRTPEMRRSMVPLLDDPNPRVREEAAGVLAELETTH